MFIQIKNVSVKNLTISWIIFDECQSR